jgi:hypothetical protein
MTKEKKQKRLLVQGGERLNLSDTKQIKQKLQLKISFFYLLFCLIYNLIITKILKLSILLPCKNLTRD